MSWDELYPIVAEQAYWAVMRYDPRRKDKVQELICQALEKYRNDVLRGKEIRGQEYKCFITQRAKEVDQRSLCKKGYGGTSRIDALSFYRRRPDTDTEVVEYDDWMTMKYNSKELVEQQLSFNVDFKDWQKKLSPQEKDVLSRLMEGYKVKDIADILHTTYQVVRTIISRLKQMFLEYFCLDEFAYP